MAVDKLVDSGALDTGLTSIADKIRSRSGGSNQLLFPTGFVSEIDNIPQGGGGGVEEKDVNFYDYDGTVVAAYTAAQFAALTEMPANPTHNGLTAQGWNWTLADAKAYVASYGALDIGQMYTTSDGKTRIYCHFDDSRKDPLLTLFLEQGSLTIDWGDGSTDVQTTMGSFSLQHTYVVAGDYVITIEPGPNSYFSIRGNTTLIFMGIIAKNNAASAIESYAYSQAIKKIEIGAGVRELSNGCLDMADIETINIPATVTEIGSSAFKNCYSLKHLNIPTGVTRINSFTGNYALKHITIPRSVTEIRSTNAFRNCYALSRVTLPDTITKVLNYCFNGNAALNEAILPNSITNLGTQIFNGCYSLNKATIPSGITSVVQSMFYSCYSLTEITVPSTITEILASAFGDCAGLKKIHLKPTTPPTLANVNAFTGVPADCVFYVPTGKLNDYQTATNWSTYASRMQEE